MNSGYCKGGPMDGRALHHSEPIYHCRVDSATKRPIPGLQGPSKQFPETSFTVGAYDFDRHLRIWRWRLDSE